MTTRRTRLLLVITALLVTALCALAFPEMKKLLLLVPFALCLLAVNSFTGCASLTDHIDNALPEGSATHVKATITGKFSATQIDADNFSKTATEVRADKLHFRHSNAWVPLIEGEVDGYVRERKPAPAAPATAVSSVHVEILPVEAAH